MGKYLSPSLTQVQESQLKCAVIWYYSDDGLFFQNAVRGALADLRFPYKWEGDEVLVREIAQKFIETDLMTDKSFFVKDCEVLDEALDEDGTMAINVNVNTDCGGCGCGDGGGTVIVEFPNPTPFPVPDLPINPSTDDGVSVPDGFDDRAEYDLYKCEYATQLVRDFIKSMGNIQVLAGLVTSLSGAAFGAYLLSATAYQAIATGLIAAGVSVVGGLAAIGIGLIGLIGFGAVGYQKFNDIFDYMNANEQQIICDVYNASDYDEVYSVFEDEVGAAIASLGLDDGIQSALQNAVEGILSAFMPAELAEGLFTFVQDLGVEDADCSTCGSGSGTAVFPFDTDEETWDLGIGRATYVLAETSVRLSPKNSIAPHPVVMKVQDTEILSRAGLPAGTPIRFTSLEVDLRETNGSYWGDGKNVVIIFRYQGGTQQSSLPIEADGVHAVAVPSNAQVETSAGGNFAMEIHGVDPIGSGSNAQVLIDKVTIGVEEI